MPSEPGVLAAGQVHPNGAIAGGPILGINDRCSQLIGVFVELCPPIAVEGHEPASLCVTDGVAKRSKSTATDAGLGSQTSNYSDGLDYMYQTNCTATNYYGTEVTWLFDCHYPVLRRDA
jgi:hypothetical protein